MATIVNLPFFGAVQTFITVKPPVHRRTLTPCSPFGLSVLLTAEGTEVRGYFLAHKTPLLLAQKYYVSFLLAKV